MGAGNSAGMVLVRAGAGEQRHGLGLGGDHGPGNGAEPARPGAVGDAIGLRGADA